ncbi:MAG: DUF116 domain-containing protein [Clostridiales bacterium]|nr:DUF116 domain-containing protein [Clostridiales bacterium]MCF8022716.1 DUF116 domain-containing protein [Clostridiales bacterium]
MYTVQKIEKKRLFIGLLGACVLSTGLLAAGIWYLIFTPEHSIIYQLVLMGIVIFIATAILLAGLGLAGIILTLWFSKTMSLLQRPMRMALNNFFPVVLVLGRIFRIDLARIRKSFVQVNNQIVMARQLKLKPEQLLLLAPHCIQNSSCQYKITNNIENCRKCGKCQVYTIIKLREKYGINVGIASGGTLARKYVKEYKPRAIVAIACERDLSSGILETSPIPVLGVTNMRPNGPCIDTCFDLSRVEEAINYFLSTE